MAAGRERDDVQEGLSKRSLQRNDDEMRSEERGRKKAHMNAEQAPMLVQK